MTGRLLDVCKEMKKINGMDAKKCQDIKKNILDKARNCGLVVGKNGNHIEIHFNTNSFNKLSFLAEMFIYEGKVIVNNDPLWKEAMLQDERDQGIDV